MQAPFSFGDDLYHKHGDFELSDKQYYGLVNTEQEKIDVHPLPVVLQPSKNVLQAASEVAVVLSLHNIGLHVDYDQIQPFKESVAAALMQANFEYD